MNDTLKLIKSDIETALTATPKDCSFHELTQILYRIVKEVDLWLIPKYEELKKEIEKLEEIENQLQVCHDRRYICQCYNTEAISSCELYTDTNDAPNLGYCELKKEYAWENCPFGKLYGKPSKPKEKNNE